MTSALAEIARHAAIPLPQQPLLVTWVKPVETSDGLLELRSDETFYPLRHPLLAAAFRAVADRLDGSLTPGEISADLPDGIEPATVIFLLKTLSAVGLLLDGSDLSPGRERELLFFSHFNAAGAAARRLRHSSVNVFGPPTLAGRVCEQLRGAGVGEVVEALDPDLADGTADLLVACADAPASEWLRKVNHAALACGVPWLRVASHGRSGWLGPLVLPGETACYACLEARQEANGRDGAEPLDLSPGAAGDFAPFLCLLAAQAAIEAARFLSGFVAPATVGGAYELSATTPQTRRQAVLRDPACGACGALWLSASELP